ncbi:helix-turn-helix domain-containing protein [Yinghuangia soli]|uniref:Helix-turn-helix domain-containing protein n=1 Tax=Yinghuangia soli TaxID=2908204 RepID=A0AA41Q0U2_9ACTN|nr:helix-turn-helix transcriptional regulator [Yinghuangia soli]MCF2529413.1 helix-turn-helix domain-containing protein [Yinghuangia soli]
MAGEEFAALLRELKERSGLSYGVLGKRLHLSGSTLHRYVNGDAVPTDYAPVERFARLCGATSEELVELHRRWVRADALRPRKGAAGAASAQEAARVAGSTGEPTADPESDVAAEPEPVMVATATSTAAEAAAGRRLLRRPGTLLGLGAAAAATIAAVLVANLLPGDGGKPDRSHPAAATTTSAAPATASGSPAVTPAPDASPQPEAAESPVDGLQPTVSTNPYKWETPCSQHYLVDRKPTQVSPPPTERDARGWITAQGAVSAGDQLLALTVQGTGPETVVLEALHVRIVAQGPPLAWNDYTMGVGCGGEVATKSFEVNLDAGRPTTVPKAGQRNFPYKVSESDPEVFYVSARTQAYDVRWYLELDWSSGDRRGTVRISDNGQPFRTSGNKERPAYTYPPGAHAWDKPLADEG